jgi:LmbE family N-acetylglucosaminyl deacetylase
MASPDHWQARQITDAAVFYSRLTKWDEQFDHLPVHVISRQLWYPLGFQSPRIPEGAGQIVVDISDYLSIKLQAIRAYQTQFPPKKERVFSLVESQNRLFGTAAGFEAGELFVTASMIGVRDLISTICAAEESERKGGDQAHEPR